MKWENVKDDPVFRTAARRFWQDNTSLIPTDFLVLELDRWEMEPPIRFTVEKVRVRARKCSDCDELHDMEYFAEGETCCEDGELETVEMKLYTLHDTEYAINLDDDGDVVIYYKENGKTKTRAFFDYESEAEEAADKRNREQDFDYDMFPFDGSTRAYWFHSCEDTALLKKAGFVKGEYQSREASRGPDYTLWNTDGDKALYFALWMDEHDIPVPTTQGDVFVDLEEQSAMEIFTESLGGVE